MTKKLSVKQRNESLKKLNGWKKTRGKDSIEKDFIFNDEYVDKEDLFRHSKWVSFMEKRLKIRKHSLTQKPLIILRTDQNCY